MGNSVTLTKGKKQTSSEQRVIQAHPKLIMDTIKRQAGTLSKAILEGLMNAVDAKASRFSIQIGSGRTKITLSDNGKGIATRSQIEQFFETFGYPHDEREGKIFAEFRMGRGQLFAFGRNVWRTGEFEMTVDVEHWGLNYRLQTGLSTVDGCQITIELYRPLTIADEMELRRELQYMSLYSPIEVLFDGQTLQRNPADEQWDRITEDAYIRFRDVGPLMVYNLGIYTLTHSNRHFGIGGTIIARKKLRVNFARNDIMSDCPVWRRIKSLIQKESDLRIGKSPKTALSGSQRDHVLKLLDDHVKVGQSIDDSPKLAGWWDMKLFQLTNRKRLSFDDLRGRVNLPWSVARQGLQKADAVMERRGGLGFSEPLLEQLDIGSVVAFSDWLKNVVKLSSQLPWRERCLDGLNRIRCVDFDTLTHGMDDHHELLTPKQLNKKEAIWLDVMREMCRGSWYAVEKLEAASTGDSSFNDVPVIRRTFGREIMLGASDTAHGWTDGTSYIAIERKFINKLPYSLQGISDLVCLLLHEMCHDSGSAGTHEHGVEFYETYHARSRWIGIMISYGQQAFLRKYIRDRLSAIDIRRLTGNSRRIV